jgi:hypothetical protein
MNVSIKKSDRTSKEGFGYEGNMKKVRRTMKMAEHFDKNVQRQHLHRQCHGIKAKVARDIKLE